MIDSVTFTLTMPSPYCATPSQSLKCCTSSVQLPVSTPLACMPTYYVPSLVEFLIYGSWLQATLPVNMGDLGIKSAVHLSPSAFLASADGSLDLVNQILLHRLHNTPYQERVEACHQWEVGLDIPPPTPPASFKQKVWDLPRVQDRVDSLLSDTNDKIKSSSACSFNKGIGGMAEGLADFISGSMDG